MNNPIFENTAFRRLSLVLSYYRQPEALEWQIDHYSSIDSELVPEIVVVDDASGDSSARDVVRKFDLRVTLVTVMEDIPWNIPGARNWGMVFASSEWCIRTDIDHLVPERTLEEIHRMDLKRGEFYLFERFLPTGLPTHRHTDSFLLSKADYWEWGGYDENLSGNYGQNARDFIARASRRGTLVETPLQLNVGQDFASPGGVRATRVNKLKLRLLNMQPARKTKKLRTSVSVAYL